MKHNVDMRIEIWPK